MTLPEKTERERAGARAGERDPEGGPVPPHSGDLSPGQRLRRATRTGSAIARIYLGYKGIHLLRRGGLDALAEVARKRWDRRSARTLHDTARDLGGVLLKAGQFFGTRADVVPEAWVDGLERLQDRVAPHRYSVVRDALRRELGAEPDEIFARFWRRPIASASLAQVHRATLHDGREVAVKVQRPEIESALRADVVNLRAAAQTLERLEGELGLSWLVEQLESTLERELDFELEARSARRMADCFASNERVVVPATVDELCTRRVVTSIYLPGIKLTDRARLERNGIDPSDLLDALCDAFIAQVFEHRLFHGDPHPGNLLVLPGRDGAQAGAFQIGLIDFGLVEDVPEEFTPGCAKLAAGLLGGDAAAIAAALRELGIDTASDRDTVAEVAAALVELRSALGSPDAAEQLRAAGERIAELLRADPLAQVPPHLVLLARTLGLLSGIAVQLGAHLDLGRRLLPWLAGQR